VTGIEEAKRLGQQRVMQVQSGIDPPKKVAQGERQIGADGDEYFTLQTVIRAAGSSPSIQLKVRRRSQVEPASSSMRRIRTLPKLAGKVALITGSSRGTVWRQPKRLLPRAAG
jgi:hypothetical protein